MIEEKFEQQVDENVTDVSEKTELNLQELKENLDSNQIFAECLKLQDTMQQRTLGPKWVDGENKQNWPADYSIASLVEIGEAIASTPFKWWKKSEEDTQNIITELIDVLHFEMSKLLISTPHATDIQNAIMTSSWLESDLEIDRKEFLLLSPQEKQEIFNQGIKKLTFFVVMPDEYKPVNLTEYFVAIFVSTFDLLKLLGCSKEDVIQRYLIKNVLNTIRSKNGYKEGTYNKSWLDISTGLFLEDNDVCIKLAKVQEIDSFDNMEKVFQDYYNEFVGIESEEK